MVGVSRSNQGKGFGGKMLEAVIKKSNELSIPIYLETETENNVRFYQKYGFKVIKKIELPVIKQTMWTMD